MRALRIAAVTAGLMAAGAVFGGIAGTVAGAVWIVIEEGFLRGLLRDPERLLYIGTYAGILGAVLGPAAAWLLMRRVPLGLAVGGTTLGTIAGGVLGLLIGGPGLILHAGISGFALSAIFLRLRVPRGDRRLGGGGASGRLPAGG